MKETETDVDSQNKSSANSCTYCKIALLFFKLKFTNRESYYWLSPQLSEKMRAVGGKIHFLSYQAHLSHFL